MRNFMIPTVLLTLVLAGKVLSAPSETINTSLPNSPDRRSKIDDQDSHLERVHVKQETGFDGKVRSIRFNLEPGKDEKIVDKQPEVQAGGGSKSKVDYAEPVPAPARTNLESDTSKVSSTMEIMSSPRKLRMAPTYDSSKKLLSITADQPEKISLTNLKSSRSKRTIEKRSSVNELDDLKAEEAKVFRPLFVYRQQVAKRLKTQNDKRSIDSGRRVQRTKPNTYGYYPYQQRTYHYYPYPYHYNQPYDVGFYQYL